MDRPIGKKRSNEAAIKSSSTVKRSRTEEIATDVSSGTASVNVVDAADHFETVPNEVLAMIISMLPVRQWPHLARINRHFQQGVSLAWQKIRDGSLAQFVDIGAMKEVSAFERKDRLSKLLTILVNHAPNLESLEGFSIFIQNSKTMELRYLRQLIRFRHLRSIDLSNCHVQVRHLAEFLSTSGSRGILEELILVNSLRFPGSVTPEVAREKRHQNDQLLGPAVANIADRPSLRLKTFIFEKNNFLSGAFLECLDVSRLKELSVAGSQIRADHLANFLNRCTSLINLNVSSIYGFRQIEVQGEDSRTINSDIIRSLGASSNLESLRLEWRQVMLTNGEIQCLRQTLADLGLRCQMKRLRIWFFDHSMNETIDIIGNHSTLTHLWLSIDNCNKSTLVRLVSRLPNLEVLSFYSPNTQSLQVDASVLNAIATHQKKMVSLSLARPGIQPNDIRVLEQLPQLKRLLIGGHYIVNSTIMNICNFGHRLESLEFLGISLASDSGMATSVKKLVNIRQLALTESQITDITLRAIAQSCPLLEELDLQYCTRISTAGVQAIINSCKSLGTLSFTKPINANDLVIGNRQIKFDGNVRRLKRSFDKSEFF